MLGSNQGPLDPVSDDLTLGDSAPSLCLNAILRLYSKNGVCRGIPIFLIFAPKHRLWVYVFVMTEIDDIKESNSIEMNLFRC